MKYSRLPLGIYQANCYVLYDEKTLEAAVIDPGGDFEELKDFIDSNKLDVKYIILTHAHADHIGALIELAKYTNADICIHEFDKAALENSELNLSSMMGKNKVETAPDMTLREGQELRLGDDSLKIIHTPGHTKGSISIIWENNIFTGDTLFAGSIGRTDLSGGSYEDIMTSLYKLIKYPDDTLIYPGHGPSSTIKKEKGCNPFIRQIL